MYMQMFLLPRIIAHLLGKMNSWLLMGFLDVRWGGGPRTFTYLFPYLPKYMGIMNRKIREVLFDMGGCHE